MVGNIVDVGWATIKSGCLPITGCYMEGEKRTTEKRARTSSDIIPRRSESKTENF